MLATESIIVKMALSIVIIAGTMDIHLAATIGVISTNKMKGHGIIIVMVLLILHTLFLLMESAKIVIRLYIGMGGSTIRHMFQVIQIPTMVLLR